MRLLYIVVALGMTWLLGRFGLLSAMAMMVVIFAALSQSPSWNTWYAHQWLLTMAVFVIAGIWAVWVIWDGRSWPSLESTGSP
jgi:hypothetical protein